MPPETPRHELTDADIDTSLDLQFAEMFDTSASLPINPRKRKGHIVAKPKIGRTTKEIKVMLDRSTQASAGELEVGNEPVFSAKELKAFGERVVEMLELPEGFTPSILAGPHGERMLEVADETDLIDALQYLSVTTAVGDPVYVDLAAVSRAITQQRMAMEERLTADDASAFVRDYERIVDGPRLTPNEVAKYDFILDLLAGGEKTIERYAAYELPHPDTAH